jgi:hypothetical protein
MLRRYKRPLADPYNGLVDESWKLTANEGEQRILFFFMVVPCINNIKFFIVQLMHGDRGSTVVKVLRYKSEGRWFDPRRCHEIFSLT